MKPHTQRFFLSRLTGSLCLISLFLLYALPLAAQTITTFAGSSSLGDGGPATDANLNYPNGVAVDGSGNLFIADQYNHRIRKINVNGVITTVAGNGVRGVSGDGGPATTAMLNYPAGIALDGNGNLFITDTQNQRIRKVDTNGIITTVAGDGTAGYNGNNGPATTAKLSNPTMAVVDRNGNLFIADRDNYRVRKVSPAGIITTVAGTGIQAYGSPDGGAATATRLAYLVGLAIDGNNNLLIADGGDNRIRKVDANGIITTVAGTTGASGFGGDGGVATAAKLNFPTGITTDGGGNLFITDQGNRRIRKVDANGTITSVAGNGIGGFSGDGGPATSARLNTPAAVAVDNQGNLFIADGSNLRIRRVDTNGVITTYAGNGTTAYGGDGRAATAARMNTPSGVAADKQGNVFIADSHNHRIRKVDATGIISTFAGSNDGGFSGDGGPAALAQLNNPTGLAVDGQGNLFIADQDNRRIRKIDANGIITTVAGTGGYASGGDGGPATAASFMTPTGIALDGNGNLFIADKMSYRVRRVATNGIITTVAGSGIYGSDGDGEAATEAKLAAPNSVAVDSQGNLLIADFYAQRIRKVDPNGIITTVVGNGTTGFSGDGGAATLATVSGPSGVAVDSQGTLFIADLGNQRVRKVDVTGIINTIAGNGQAGFGGDGGPATAALLNGPYSIALDGKGNLFIVDLGNQRVRKVTPVSVGMLIVSVQSGDWLTASTWDCNCVPGGADVATISAGHSVTVSQSVQITALKVYGQLRYTAAGKVSF